MTHDVQTSGRGRRYRGIGARRTLELAALGLAEGEAP